MKELKDTIKSGGPETKSRTPASIQVYWNVRDELSEVEGVILKNDRILVPSSMRKEMLPRIHQGHMGIEKSKRWHKSEQLIVVDYHSRYFEVAKLPDTKSTTVIT